MTVYIETSQSAVCRNPDCEQGYLSYETYDFEEVKTDKETGKDYVICWYCKQKVWLED